MPEAAPVTDIVVSKGSVYQMTSKEKKGLDWVMSETMYLLMLTLLKQFHPEKEQLMRIDLGPISIYFRIYHTFLVISKKVGQTFLSTISQPLKDGILLQLMKEIQRCI